jgi:hypothetical protein
VAACKHQADPNVDMDDDFEFILDSHYWKNAHSSAAVSTGHGLTGTNVQI